jgi:gamma-glutamyltranspeptidase/glutathione hydrolase
MYTGEWAKKLVAMVRRDGGKMTMEDLKNYQVSWSEPLEIFYGDYRIYAPGLPAVGGVNIAQALNVASEAGLSNMGHYSESPEAFFWLFQINKLSSQAFRSKLLGGVDASLPSLATKAHAERVWAIMSKGEFGMTSVPISRDPNHSDAIVAIDKWGNVAALVHSINSVIWGETGIFVDGVSISDIAAYLQQMILETGPGKQLPGGLEPLIISRNGKPVVALASVGSGLHQATNSVLFNIMDFNMGLKEAIDAPSLHTPKYLDSGISIPQVYSGGFSEELLAGVKELGLEVEVILFSEGYPGWVIGAMIDDEDLRKAVPSPRGNGVALGY